MSLRVTADSPAGKTALTMPELRLLLDNMICPFAYFKMICDDHGRPIDYQVLAVNRAFERETGFTRAQIIGKRALELHPHSERYWIQRFGKVSKSAIPARFVNYSSFFDKWYDVQAYSPSPGNVAITVSDVTFVYRDAVTKLPNKNAFLQMMKNRIDDGSTPCCFSIVLLDLDDFKDINASFGSVIGDRLLLSVAARLRAYANDRCEIYSYNGDEFILYLKNCTGERELGPFMDGVLEELMDPFYLDNNCFYVTASCGIASYPMQGKTVEELMMNADLAKHRAKERTRGSYHIFDDSMGNSLLKKIRMQTALRQAYDNEEFFLCYQPQIDAKTRRVVGFEALIRWNSPEFGLVPPLSFIHTAEETRLIVPIGEWVLKTACRYIKALNERLHTNYVISVNISGIQILQDDFIDRMADILSEVGLDTEFLELEITESSFFDSIEKLAEKVDILRSFGLKIALDDFGTGFSSLSELKNLEISALKIDKSFIDDIALSEKNQHLIKAINLTGHALDLEIVAEGVETDEQLEVAVRLGCDRIQGYRISKPLPGEDIPSFLSAYTANP